MSKCCSSCKEAPVAKVCHSCTAPLDNAMFKGISPIYCKHCSDAKGNLKVRAEVQKLIAQWFIMWQPGINEAKALERAAHFMKGLPAWAE